jgi:hypothetical protein
MMKKLVMFVAGACVAGFAFGQATFGVKGGINPSVWNVKIGDDKEDDYKSRIGFHLGAVVDFAISESFSIQPQLLFVNKGSKEKHGDHDDKILVNALDIPVNFLYKTAAGSGKFFIGGGPNLGFNLSAQIKGEHDGEMEKEKLEIGSNAGQLRAFDFGINALAGYEFSNGLFLSANFTPGIANLSNAANTTARSSYFGLSFGYFFGKKSTKTSGN